MADPITRRVTPGQDPATRLGAKPAAEAKGAVSDKQLADLQAKLPAGMQASRNGTGDGVTIKKDGKNVLGAAQKDGQWNVHGFRENGIKGHPDADAARAALDQVLPTGAAGSKPATTQDASAVKAKAGADATSQAIAGAKPAENADLGAALDKLKSKGAADAKEAAPLQRFKDNDAAAVKDVQQKLKDLGHYKGEVDGKYGPDTDKAVREFQKANKDAEGQDLKQDGSVGAKTKAALDKKAAEKAPAGGEAKPAVTPEKAAELAKDPEIDKKPLPERVAGAEVAAEQPDAKKLAESAMVEDPASITKKGVENAARTSPQATELVADVAERREETPNEVVSKMQPDAATALAGVHAKDENPSAAAQTVYAVKPENQPAVAAQTFQGANGGATAASFLGKAMHPASQDTPNELKNLDSGTLRNAIAAIERDRGQTGVGTKAIAAANAARRELERRGETP